MLRLFIAVELPASLQAGIGQLQDKLARDALPDVVRWVDPASIHLTLKFLGDVPAPQRPDIEREMAQAAAHAPFDLTARGLGCFPNFKQPRVVWVGMDGNLDALHALRDTVERTIAPLGYPTEKRKFSPHLTLGRVKKHAGKRDVQRLGEQLEPVDPGTLGELTVTGISLMRSQLRPSGAVYTQLSHVSLEGGDG
jgi:2'-5' RNA ligase